METLMLSDYGAVISDSIDGEKIYNNLKKKLISGKVEVSFAGVITMATYCAKQVFGRLYIELGSKNFFDNVILKDASNDLKFIVKIGIQSALDDNKSLK